MPEKERPSYWLPVQHSMLRRNQLNNYHGGHKAYMVTLRVEGMVPLLGKIEECADPVRMAECRLTALGEAMRQAWLTLPQRFHNIVIYDKAEEFVVMPEHFHGIVYVTSHMQEHLSDVIRLFKARVAMAYRHLLVQGATTPVGTAKDWLKAYQALTPAQQAEAQQWIREQARLLYSATSREKQYSAPPFKVTATGSHSKTGFLFGIGYSDSLLLGEDNLEGHRLYIYNNPKSRWLRSRNRQLLKANKAGIDTAVSISALEGYLKRECPARDVTEEKLEAVRRRLLYSATSRRIVCHTYGDRGLLERRMLPVVCHRKDAPLFSRQKERCLDEAAAGAVMVSAGISPKEREIMQAVMAAGCPVVSIIDNGFPELYHPSQEDIERCEAGRMLLVSPWQYHYRHKDDAIFVAYCKTMNCIAQAICRREDDWWR